MSQLPGGPGLQRERDVEPGCDGRSREIEAAEEVHVGRDGPLAEEDGKAGSASREIRGIAPVMILLVVDEREIEIEAELVRDGVVRGERADETPAIELRRPLDSDAGDQREFSGGEDPRDRDVRV